MRGQSGMPGNEYADGMIEHDGDVGKLLKALDDLGIANDTIVVYTTDNGPNQFTGPTRRRRRSAARRTPIGKERSACRRWCAGRATSSRARSRPRSFPDSTGSRRCSPRRATRRSRTGCSKGQTSGGTTFKVHLDGYNQLPYLAGQDDNESAHRFLLFRRRRGPRRLPPRRLEGGVRGAKEAGRLSGLVRAADRLRIPKLFNLRMDPYERADVVSDQYDDWRVKNAYLMGWMRPEGRRLPPNVQGLSAEPDAGELHHRSDPEGHRSPDRKSDYQGDADGLTALENNPSNPGAIAKVSPRPTVAVQRERVERGEPRCSCALLSKE